MWFTSSCSNGTNCVGCRWVKSTHSSSSDRLEWRTSSHSSFGDSCVETADGILVRDSRLGEASPVLRFPPQAWARFTSGLK